MIDLGAFKNGERDGFVRLGKQAFYTAHERPDQCQHGKGTCRMRAVGFVVFGGGAFSFGVPIGVPLPVCEKHFMNLYRTHLVEEEQHPDRQVGNVVNECQRYVQSEYA